MSSSPPALENDNVNVSLKEDSALLSGQSEQQRWEALREKQREHKAGMGAYGSRPASSFLGRVRESGNLLCLVFALVIVIVVVVFALVYMLAPGAGPRAHFCQFTANVSISYVEGRRIYETIVSNDVYSWASVIVSRDSANGTFGNIGVDGAREIHQGKDAVVVGKFFGRDVCDIIPMTAVSSMCVDTTSSSWMLEAKKMVCPTVNHPDSPFQVDEAKAQQKYCSKWAIDYLGIVKMEYYLEYKTHYPVRLTQKVDSTSVTLDYLSFVPGKPVRQDIFDYSTITCTDYRVQSNSPSSNNNNNNNEARDADDILINDMGRIDTINSAAVGWTAGRNKRFDGMSIADFKRQRLVQAPVLGKYFVSVLRNSDRQGVENIMMARKKRGPISIPSEYDARNVWQNCSVMRAVYDQRSCGCCYAMAAVETLADRICVSSAGKVDTPLSVQWVIGCHTNLNGCSGGWTDVMWKNLVLNGTTTRSCVSFLESDSECPSVCDNGKDITFVTAKSAVNCLCICTPFISY